MFEPDHDLLIQKDFYSVKVQEEWANYILDLFECNFLSKYFLRKNGSVVFSQHSKSIPGGKVNRVLLENFCKMKKIRVIKTIKPADVKILFQQARKRGVVLRAVLFFR